MARSASWLTAIKVKKINTPGLHPDGEGLNLQVSKTGAKSWIFRYSRNGKAHQMGLGSCQTVGLADARNQARECKKRISQGLDPICERKAERKRNQLQSAKTKNFEECAKAYIEAHEVGWKNTKHKQQWRNTLSAYAFPIFGSISVQDIDTNLVMKVLEPIWNGKTETAKRLRGRIENILDWAKTMGFRDGENPAR